RRALPAAWSAVRWAAARSMSAAATWAPTSAIASAVARPIPAPAPVTSTISSCKTDIPCLPRFLDLAGNRRCQTTSPPSLAYTRAGRYSSVARAALEETSGYGASLFVTCKRNLDGKNGMLRSLRLGLLLGTVLGSVAWAQGWAKFDGQYTGELTLTKE